MASSRNLLRRLIAHSGLKPCILPLSVAGLASLVLLSYMSYGASIEPGNHGRSSPPSYQDQSVERASPVGRFARLVSEHKIDNVKLRYVRWDLESSRRISEHDLMSFPADCTIDGGAYIADLVSVKLLEAFSHRRLEKKEIAPSELDFSLAATFFAGGDEILRICISKYPPAVSLNGEIFAAPSRVVHALTSLLPAAVREGMFLYTIDEWATPPYKETVGGMRRMENGDSHLLRDN